jgi:histidine phosphotransferase ChpT
MVGDASLGKGPIKILLNLALIAGDALVRGGRLDIGVENGATATEIVIRSEGPRIVLDPELRTALTGGTAQDQLTPRAAAAWLVWHLAHEQGGEVLISEPQDGVLMVGCALPHSG